MQHSSGNKVGYNNNGVTIQWPDILAYITQVMYKMYTNDKINNNSADNILSTMITIALFLLS